MRRLIAPLLLAATIALPAAADEIHTYGTWTIIDGRSHLDETRNATASTFTRDHAAILTIGCSSQTQTQAYIVFPDQPLSPRDMLGRWRFDDHPIRTGTWRISRRAPTISVLTTRNAAFIAEATDATRLVIQVDGVEFEFDLTGAVGAIGSVQRLCDI